MTQEILAERAGLSSDTVRRLESDKFSPTLATISKLCRGLGLSLSTLFASYDGKSGAEENEVMDLLMSCSRRQRRQAWRVLRAMLDENAP